jgi:hypothetical protein
MTDEPREINPYSVWNGNNAEKDFSINPTPSDADEPAEVIPDPAPKGSSAPASADSLTSTQTDGPLASGTGAPKAADKENGELNEPNAVTNPELFLPSSSSETNLGWNEPPASVLPPTSDPTPTL